MYAQVRGQHLQHTLPPSGPQYRRNHISASVTVPAVRDRTSLLQGVPTCEGQPLATNHAQFIITAHSHHITSPLYTGLRRKTRMLFSFL